MTTDEKIRAIAYELRSLVKNDNDTTRLISEYMEDILAPIIKDAIDEQEGIIREKDADIRFLEQQVARMEERLEEILAEGGDQ